MSCWFWKVNLAVVLRVNLVGNETRGRQVPQKTAITVKCAVMRTKLQYWSLEWKGKGTDRSERHYDSPKDSWENFGCPTKFLEGIKSFLASVGKALSCVLSGSHPPYSLPNPLLLFISLTESKFCSSLGRLRASGEAGPHSSHRGANLDSVKPIVSISLLLSLSLV